MLKKNKFDIIFPTYYNNYYLEYCTNKKIVYFVHDMIFETFPPFCEDNKHESANKKLLIERANVVIAVSNNTKKDILKLYPHINEDKIHVVHLSHSNPTTITDIALPEKYLLFVGNRSFYKNFIFLVNTVAPLLLDNDELCLVCAGGPSFTDEEVALISRYNLQNKIVHIKIQDNQLPTIYAKAVCFIFPSEYEGFGIPVLEAMANNCPVILPYTSSFPEVAEKGGIYFELNNPVELKTKIEKCMTDENFRQSYIELGKIQANKFSWEKTFEQIIALCS